LILHLISNLNLPGGRTQVVGPLWALSKIFKLVAALGRPGLVQIQRLLSAIATCNNVFFFSHTKVSGMFEKGDKGSFIYLHLHLHLSSLTVFSKLDLGAGIGTDY
jgi:hypothetical protein